jgi:hypothetical protein
MAHQVINNDGDAIDNVQVDNWSKGECIKPWVEPQTYSSEYSEEYS